MGYLRHECLVVSSWDSESVDKAHEAACAIFNEVGMGSIVSGLTRHAINGGAAFMIAPDGSKEGWQHSDEASASRAELIDILRPLGVEWALVLLGGDDGEFKILQSPNDAPTPPSGA